MDKVIGIISANYSYKDMNGLVTFRTISSVPFGGRYRLIDFPLSNMVNSGMTTVGVVLPIPHQNRSLLDHIGFGKEWTLNRKVGGLFFLPGSHAGTQYMSCEFPLQDLEQNKEYLTRTEANYVVVSSSNNVYNIDYRPVVQELEQKHADIMLVCKPDMPHYPNVLRVTADSENRVTDLSRKLSSNSFTFINTFVIRRKILLDLLINFNGEGCEDAMVAIRENLRDLDVRVYFFPGYVGMISSVSDYFRCSQDVLRSEVRKELFFSQRIIRTKVHDDVPTRFYRNAVVSNSLINAGCSIEGTVENSILFRGVQVKKGAVVRNSIIMSHVQIGQNAFLENTIMDKNFIIQDGEKYCGSPEHPFVGEKRIIQLN